MAAAAAEPDPPGVPACATAGSVAAAAGLPAACVPAATGAVARDVPPTAAAGTATAGGTAGTGSAGCPDVPAAPAAARWERIERRSRARFRDVMSERSERMPGARPPGSRTAMGYGGAVPEKK